MSHQRVAVRCPSCSPGTETAHEVLNRGGQATVRCGDCGHVHKATIGTESTVERRVIVSQDDESDEAFVEMPPDEELSTGEEFLVETDSSSSSGISTNASSDSSSWEMMTRRSTVDSVSMVVL